MAFDRKILASVIGALTGLGVSIIWLWAGQWALSAYHIDVGDLYYTWNPSPNPVACWLAFGPLPLFIAIGFIASYGLASGVEGKKKDAHHILIIVAGFFLWLLILGALSLLHYSISAGQSIKFGNGLVVLILLFAMILDHHYAYGRAATNPGFQAMSSQKAYAGLGLAIILMFVFIITWYYAVGQAVLFLLSNHYLVDASYDLFIHDPAIDWIQNGLVLLFLALSFIISYSIIDRDCPEKKLRDKSSFNLLVYALLGCLVWLTFCVVLSVLSIKIDPGVSSSSGYVLVAISLMVFIDDFVVHFRPADQSRPETFPSPTE